MNKQRRKILMTSALPYANGDIHLGHMVETIQADIWARWQRQMGNECLFICGDDAHGTAIMLSAEKQGITPEQLIKQVHAAHSQDYQDFLISFDNFYTTHSPENKELSNLIYQRLKEKGDISTKEIKQAYDPEKKLFLSDRYIRGECPCCHAQDQYGDNCEKCGSTYSPTELINPRSAISGAIPIEKKSLHYFFDVDRYQELLQQWITTGHLQPQVTHKLQEWFKSGLRSWDISRDAPYFGFEIPDAPGKYFYVWLDAPVGYMASLKDLEKKRPEVKFEEFWGKNSDIELYHFVGKDIIYFHSLFWPAMLAGAEFRTPTAIFAHGFLTINGQKMSKSRGTFITARHYLNLLNPEYLRYYFAAKLNAQVEDIDINLNDFAARINADLVGKFVNLASRCAGFITQKFAGQLASELPDINLFQTFVEQGEEIAQHFIDLDYNRGIREIMALADRANQYIDHHKPWALAKKPECATEVQAICTQGLNLFKLLATYLQPILPQTAAKVAEFFNITELKWDDIKNPLLNHTIQPFKPLMQRITPEIVTQLINEKKTEHHC